MGNAKVRAFERNRPRKDFASGAGLRPVRGDAAAPGRAVGRRICKKCGATYHVKFNPPKKEAVCDTCAGDLYQRADDSEETMKNRLSVYEAQTKPLIAYYKKAGVYKEIDGRQDIAKVEADLAAVLEA